MNQDGGDWSDKNSDKPWWDNMGLPTTKDLGANDEEGTGFVAIMVRIWGGYGVVSLSNIYLLPEMYACIIIATIFGR